MRRPPAVARVLERVRGTARAHEMFLPGRTVLVAVSGGPDSVCLLESLVRMRRLFRIHLRVFHLDHRLREGSAADAAYVRRLAARHGLAFDLRTAEGAPPRGASVEAWARGERRAAMAEAARDADAATIALGHTMDDQAETVLMNLITGSGLSGLAGIRPVSGPYVEPLLEVSRAEVEAFCRALHLRPRHDPMNDDRRFLRVAVREAGLPALERAAGRSLREPIARTAEGLREDADELRRRAMAEVDRVMTEDEEGVDLEVAALLGLPRAVGGRVVAHAMYTAGAVGDRSDVAAVFDLADGRPGRRRDLSDGVKATRASRHVRLSRSLHFGP